MKSDVWALNLDNVKFTDNKLVFAQKNVLESRGLRKGRLKDEISDGLW